MPGKLKTQGTGNAKELNTTYPSVSALLYYADFCFLGFPASPVNRETAESVCKRDEKIFASN